MKETPLYYLELKPEFFALAGLSVPTKPTGVMIYAENKRAAPARLADYIVSCERATALQIATHARAGLPFVGEPTPPDPNQAPPAAAA